jgi:hypothetical protein
MFLLCFSYNCVFMELNEFFFKKKISIGDLGCIMTCSDCTVKLYWIGIDIFMCELNK